MAPHKRWSIRRRDTSAKCRQSGHRLARSGVDRPTSKGIRAEVARLRLPLPRPERPAPVVHEGVVRPARRPARRLSEQSRVGARGSQLYDGTVQHRPRRPA